MKKKYEDTKNYDVLIFDMNNLYHRASNAEDKTFAIYKNAKLLTQGISGSLSRIDKYMKKFLKNGGQIYFLFDNSNGGENPVKGVYSFYKEGRKTYTKPFYRGLDLLEFILKSYADNNYILRTCDLEADDWVKPVTDKIILDNKKALMISTDMDFTRSLSDDIHWYSFYNKKIFTPSDFEMKYGFKPTESSITFYKCFYGDSADGIEGVYPQMSPKKFQYIIDNFKDMKEFLQGCREKSIPLFNSSICARMLKEKHKLSGLWELISYTPISESAYRNNLVVTKENLLKLKTIYQALGITVDKRCKSSNDLIDDMFSKEFIKRG